MRLSSLSVVTIVLSSSIAFAQHSSNTSSAPSPSPAPSAAPTHVSSPATSPSFSSSPSVPISHSSSPSTSVSVPQPHVAPTPSVAPSPSSATARTAFSPQNENRSTGAVSPSRVQEPAASHIVPQEKIAGETRIISAPRIGEHPTEKEKDARSAPDLRRRVCEGKDCINTQEKMVPPKPDLRHHVCLTGPCTCPPGQAWGKGGCSGGVVPATGYTIGTACGAGTFWDGSACVAAVNACPPGQVWNGVACAASVQCRADEIWDGLRCVDSAYACASYEGRAAPLISGLRNLRVDLQEACSQNPSGQACAELQAQQQGTMDQYMALWNEAPAACHARLPEPGSLM